MKFSEMPYQRADIAAARGEICLLYTSLGWRDGGRYLPLKDDIASVAYWYQTLPAAPFPPLPPKDELEIN